MSTNALTLRYDKPVDRIAARLLWKAPEFSTLPETVRANLIIEPPRIRPEDVTFIFDKPPLSCEKQQPQDHRGEKRGVYLVLGHAGSKRSYEQSPLALHGGRKTRCGYNKTGIVPVLHFRGRVQRASIRHYWWVRGPDGTVESVEWARLSRLLPGETVQDLIERKRAERSGHRNET